MEIELLTAEERIEVQMHYVRVYFARKRRREFDERRRALDELWARTKRYDVSGRLIGIGIGNESCAPRMTSRQEDREPVDVPGTCQARTRHVPGTCLAPTVDLQTCTRLLLNGHAEIHAVERRVDERPVHDRQPGGGVQA